MRTFTQVNESRKDIKFGSHNVNAELVYVCENEKQLGCLTLLCNEKAATIYAVEILNRFRGKGYGKMLMENAIEICKTKNVEELRLSTEITNEASNKLYKNLGFEIEKTDEDFNYYILKLNK